MTARTPDQVEPMIAQALKHDGPSLVEVLIARQRASPKQAFAIYYGADYFGRNFFPDTTNTAHPGTIIGYGGPGSPNTNNRAILPITFDWLQTLWKDRRFWALQTYVQYSYLTRTPSFFGRGDLKNARLSMVYAGVRYDLPSTAGTLPRVPYPN